MTPPDASIPEPQEPSGGSGSGDAARPGDAFEPDLPQFIPMARPVPILDYAVRLDARPRVWRALFQLIMLIPAGLVGGMIGYMVARWMGIHDEKWQIVASTVGMGAASVMGAAFFVFIEGQRAADIGWTSRAFLANVGLGVAALLATYVTVAAMFFTVAILHPGILEQQETAGKAVRETMPAMSIPKMALFMGFVALWEEVVFRGFVLTRLKVLLGRWWLAVPLSSLVFGAVHVYEGPLAVVMISVLGLVMAILFIWRRSLVPCITLHFLNNFVMLLLLDAEM